MGKRKRVGGHRLSSNIGPGHPGNPPKKRQVPYGPDRQDGPKVGWLRDEANPAPPNQ